jgi:xanthine dehydrogenase YagR molybdenum-binding subunit
MSVVSDVKTATQGAMQAPLKKAVELAPDSWMPGGKPDPLINHRHGLIGAPVSRIDGPLKVQGKAKFAAEFVFDRLTYAAVAFSTIAKGRIVSLDTAEVEGAPGVVLVMTHKNAPRMQPMPLLLSSAKAAGGDNLPIMQDERIHWNGQPIAVVVAETQEEADHARSLIRANYEEEPAVTAFDAAKQRGTETGVFMGEPLQAKIGDAEKALAEAPNFRRQHLSHAPPQPQRHRIARGYSGLEWRRSCRSRRVTGSGAHRLVANADFQT